MQGRTKKNSLQDENLLLLSEFEDRHLPIGLLRHRGLLLHHVRVQVREAGEPRDLQTSDEGTSNSDSDR